MRRRLGETDDDLDDRGRGCAREVRNDPAPGHPGPKGDVAQDVFVDGKTMCDLYEGAKIALLLCAVKSLNHNYLNRCNQFVVPIITM